MTTSSPQPNRSPDEQLIVEKSGDLLRRLDSLPDSVAEKFTLATQLRLILPDATEGRLCCGQDADGVRLIRRIEELLNETNTSF